MSFESNNGTYNTNSDGSFHKPILIETLEQRSQNPQSGITNIYYPEAIELSKDVVHVRFYSEGIYGGRNSSGPYRTRVTMNWIKEGGKWVVKTQHYSPAVYGGVHMPDVQGLSKLRRDMKFLLLILITLVPGALLSETSEQYTYRAEFFLW